MRVIVSVTHHLLGVGTLLPLKGGKLSQGTAIVNYISFNILEYH